MEIQIIIIALAIFQVLFPLFLTWRFFRRRFLSRWQLGITAVTLVLFYSSTYYLAPWHFLSVYWAFLLPMQMFAVVGRAIQYWPTTPALKFGEPRQTRLVLLMWILFGAYLTRQNIAVVKTHMVPAEDTPIELFFPLKDGHYVVGQGGSDGVSNHHSFHQQQHYALDIVALNSFGIQRSKFFAPELTDFEIYGKPVVAPCKGIVTKVVDGEADQKPWDLSVLSGIQQPYGNTITLSCEGVDVHLAHLMKGSLKVELNQQVQVGDELAAVGNSGNTTEPHLHIHASKSDGLKLGVPMYFDGKYLIRGNNLSR